MTDAERYATLPTDRAIRIIAARAIPVSLTFPLTDQGAMDERLICTSRIVRALDQCVSATGTTSRESQH